METLTRLLILAMVVLSLARYLVGVPLPRVVLALECLYAIALLALPHRAHRFQSWVLPGWVIILGLLLNIFVAAQAEGGLEAPSLVALPLAPLLTMLLLGRGNLPILLPLMSSMLLGLYGLERGGWIGRFPLDEQGRNLSQLWMVVAVTLFCTVLAYQCDRQNEQTHDQLTLWANTDGLTGVANRRLFDECLNQEWLRNQRIAQPLSLLLVDIDYFKRYNDVHGHVEGDRCLRAVAQAIARHCRRSGELVARYGGEEFGVILPNVALAEAAAIADSLRRDIEALHGNGHPDLQEPVTVSIGFASTVPHHFAQQKHLIVQADKALYRAKRVGRNQSVGSALAIGRVNA